eukprot:5468388-Pleurochrysis_carterae.AAC.11
MAVMPLREKVALLDRAVADAVAAHAAEVVRAKAVAMRQAETAREDGAASSAPNGGQRRERKLKRLRTAMAEQKCLEVALVAERARSNDLKTRWEEAEGACTRARASVDLASIHAAEQGKALSSLKEELRSSGSPPAASGAAVGSASAVRQL